MGEMSTFTIVVGIASVVAAVAAVWSLLIQIRRAAMRPDVRVVSVRLLDAREVEEVKSTAENMEEGTRERIRKEFELHKRARAEQEWEEKRKQGLLGSHEVRQASFGPAFR